MKKFASILSGAVALALLSPGPAAALQPAPPPRPGHPTFNPCCPPWNSARLQSMLFYQSSGAIGAPYTLKFHPTPLLNTQLNAYINYLHTLGLGITTLTIRFELFNAGNGPAPIVGPLATPAQNVTWTGGVSPNPTLFPNNVMVVNRWYRIRTQISLGGHHGPFLPRECVTSYVDVRIQVFPGARARAPMLQFRTADGRSVEQAIEQ